MTENEIAQLDGFHKELGELLVKYRVLGLAALGVTRNYEIFTTGVHCGLDPCKAIVIDVEQELRKMQEEMTGEPSMKVREGVVTPQKRKN